MIEIKLISAEETYEIRKEMLRKNIPLTEKTEGDFKESTFHLGALIDGELVSVATFVENKNPYFQGNQYRLRGMATDKVYQGKGLGRKLILKAEEILKVRKADVLWFNARIGALDFYKKLGYEIIGEEFDIQYIGGHFNMYKKFTNA
ncbi:MAG: ribosomal protein S18 acetylase RimI-like enzyme [Porticoccaceae bacterium]|jgi:ribosomal protein S18 acetylase RimI-like enzyme